MLLNCGVGEDSWESLGQQGDQTSQCWRKSVLNIHWRADASAETSILWPLDAKKWLIWKDPGAGKDWKQEEKGTTMRWLDGITDSMDMSWASSRRWWRTGKPGVLQSMGSQWVGHDRATGHGTGPKNTEVETYMWHSLQSQSQKVMQLWKVLSVLTMSKSYSVV